MLFARWWGGDEGNTFNPRKGHKPGTRTLRLHQYAENTLGSGNLRKAVALPEGEDELEWLACKTMDLFNEVALVHGMISDFCTDHSCPRMTTFANYEYKWADGVKYKKPTDVSAPQYMSLLLQWVQTQLDDQAIFPTEVGVPFPSNFRETVINIFRRLFRIYAHIFFCHHERVVELTFDAHLNSCFKHFMYFVLEFNLVRTEELKPLQPLIDKMLADDATKWGAATSMAATSGAATGAVEVEKPQPSTTLPHKQSL